MYPEARVFSLPGPYDVAVGSAIQDTSHGLRDCEEIFRLERSAVARSLRYGLANRVDRPIRDGGSVGEKKLISIILEIMLLPSRTTQLISTSSFAEEGLGFWSESRGAGLNEIIIDQRRLMFYSPAQTR